MLKRTETISQAGCLAIFGLLSTQWWAGFCKHLANPCVPDYTWPNQHVPFNRNSSTFLPSSILLQYWFSNWISVDFHYLSESSRSRNICQLLLDTPTVPSPKRWPSNVICKVLPPYVKPLRSSRLVVPPSHSVGPCDSVNQPVEHPRGT